MNLCIWLLATTSVVGQANYEPRVIYTQPSSPQQPDVVYTAPAPEQRPGIFAGIRSRIANMFPGHRGQDQTTMQGGEVIQAGSTTVPANQGIVSNYVPAQQMADGFVTFGNVQVAADGTVIYGDGHQVQGVVTSGDVQQTQAVVIQGNVPQVQEAVYAPPQYSQAVQTPYGVVQMQPETITQMPMPVQQQMITQMPQRPEMITQMPQKMEAITGLPQPVIIQPVAAQGALLDLTAQPDGKVKIGFQKKIGHGDNYEWITGQLSYMHVDGGVWVVRYAGLEEEDRFGGSVVLAPAVSMKNFREGDLVRVHGEVLDQGHSSHHLGGPLYRVNSVQILERSN